MTDFNPEMITLPAELEKRQFLTFEEFGSLVGGLQGQTIRKWGKQGIIRTKKFTPRCTLIPITEIGRLIRGELMEKEQKDENKDTENTR